MKKFIFLYAFLCLFLPLAAQNNGYPRFSNISTKDGLPDNDIYNIFQDKTGYLWFGSYSTLTRYDGYNVKVYVHDPDNPSSPPKGALFAMTEDIYGNCWVASDVGGLVKFDATNQKFTPYRFLPKGQTLNMTNGISSMLSDNIGNLWIITRNVKIERINIKTWKIELYDFQKFCDLHIRVDKVPMCKDNNGGIWVGFKKYNPVTDSFELPALSADDMKLIKKRVISCIASDDSGNIWIAYRKGIIEYNISTKKLKEFLIWNGDADVVSIAIDDWNNSVWTCSNTFGLCKMDKITGRTSYSLPNPKNNFDRVIHSFFFDSQHNLWTSNGDGLNKLAPISQNFKQYAIDSTGKKGIKSPIIRALYMEGDDVLWVGGRGGGLNKVTLKPEIKYENYLLEPVTNEYGNNFVNFISSFRRNVLLVGTNTGLYFFNTKSKKVVKHLALYESNKSYTISLPSTVWAVLEDTGQYLWIGTQGAGLFLYNIKSEKLESIWYSSANRNLLGHAVWYLLKDKKNNIWGGSDTGVFKICRNVKGGICFQQYSEMAGKKNSYQGQDTWQILEDEDGILWIASIGGLNRFDPATGLFKCFTVKDGLPSNSIGGILEARKNILLISTLKGLCVFDKSQNKVLNNYYESDGLQSDHLGFRTCVKSTNGEIFLGGQNGINSFFLDNIKQDQDTSPVVITSFKKYYKDFTAELLHKSSIILNYDENSISFEFAVLDYTNTSKNQFRYYLEGIEKDWSQPGYNHFAGYNYLPPGEYVFHLIGKNSANIWSKPISFAITIRPAFWNRLWFRLSSFTLLSAFTGVFLHSLVKQQNEKRKRLESDLTALRAQLNPHFIFNSLSSLHYFITAHKEILALEYVSNFAMLIRMILNNSQLSFVSLEEEIKLLRLYIYMESVRFDNNINFDINVDASLNLKAAKIPPMLIQPLIENSMKHGLLGTQQNGKVIITFRDDDYYIYAIVEDNGIGLKQAEANKKERFIDFPSFSTATINDRLQKIKDKAGRRGSLTLENIEQDGLIMGVKATIKIPKRIKTN